MNLFKNILTYSTVLVLGGISLALLAFICWTSWKIITHSALGI